VSYGALHLIDLPTQAERVRLGAHSSHKARVYRKTGSSLFYESDRGQALEIARMSGLPVLCPTDMTLYRPTGLKANIENANLAPGPSRGAPQGWLYRAGADGLCENAKGPNRALSRVAR